MCLVYCVCVSVCCCLDFLNCGCHSGRGTVWLVASSVQGDEDASDALWGRADVDRCSALLGGGVLDRVLLRNGGGGVRGLVVAEEDEERGVDGLVSDDGVGGGHRVPRCSIGCGGMSCSV